MIEFTDSNFQKEVLQCDLPVLVVFAADWSGLCHIMDPILEKLDMSNKGNIRIGKLDAERYGTVASTYGVDKYPTIILFGTGKIIWRYSGLISLEILTSQLKSILNKGL